MSRLGKLPVKLPDGVSAELKGKELTVRGPKGEVKLSLPTVVRAELIGTEITVTVAKPEVKKDRSLWGLFRTLIANMVTGVNEGYQKALEINGVGYRARVEGQKLVISAGFSHPVEFMLPAGITAAVEGNVITVAGIDKQAVGETAARIRKIKVPEPYKGKGIKYADETIRRKAGKAAAKTSS